MLNQAFAKIGPLPGKVLVKPAHWPKSGGDRWRVLVFFGGASAKAQV
jgi:hypothetical protein